MLVSECCCCNSTVVYYADAGNSSQASLYCYHTLHRQHQEGLHKPGDIIEWCVNCAGLSEFFTAIQNYRQAAYVLQCAEKVLGTIEPAAMPSELRDKYDDLRANLQRKYIKLELTVFKTAIQYVDQWEEYKRRREEVLQVASGSEGEGGMPTPPGVSSLPPPPPPDADTGAPITTVLTDFIPFHRLGVASLDYITADIHEYSRVQVQSAPDRSSSSSSSGSSNQWNICSYEDARLLFLRIQRRLELAKKHYVMDGGWVGVLRVCLVL